MDNLQHKTVCLAKSKVFHSTFSFVIQIDSIHLTN